MSPRDPQTIRLRLLEQLVLFDEQRIRFLDTYFPFNGTSPQQRLKVDQLLQRYAGVLEATVKKLADNDAAAIDKVLIGCRVTIEYEDTRETETLTLCMPDQTDPDRGHISFLSPLGLKLLLSASGDTIALDTPAGETKIYVCGVSVPDYAANEDAAGRQCG